MQMQCDVGTQTIIIENDDFKMSCTNAYNDIDLISLETIGIESSFWHGCQEIMFGIKWEKKPIMKHHYNKNIMIYKSLISFNKKRQIS